MTSGMADASTRRVNAYRRRRRTGLLLVKLEVGPAEIGKLVERGYLEEEQRGDPVAIQDAVGSLLCDVASGAV